ncbi:unnamed protein product [Cylicostephanus goldi]|uniref:Uncharacterized protein n=1 Tax=Cylicostephanus goldi TaxID=71465 RepID=A0A3P6SVC1_CYLGO|nr:unnamed protein product [Cylicostephanus goldi]
MYSDDDYIPQYCVMAGPSGDENVPLTLGSGQKSGKDSQHLHLDDPYIWNLTPSIKVKKTLIDAEAGPCSRDVKRLAVSNHATRWLYAKPVLRM